MIPKYISPTIRTPEGPTGWIYKKNHILRSATLSLTPLELWNPRILGSLVLGPKNIEIFKSISLN